VPNPLNFSKGASIVNKTVLTAPILEKWVQGSNVIDILFGESFHQDLASKSDVVIIFMALRNILTLEHLQAIK